jgi:hypothetical protein
MEPDVLPLIRPWDTDGDGEMDDEEVYLMSTRRARRATIPSRHR